MNPLDDLEEVLKKHGLPHKRHADHGAGESIVVGSSSGSVSLVLRGPDSLSGTFISAGEVDETGGRMLTYDECILPKTGDKT